MKSPTPPADWEKKMIEKLMAIKINHTDFDDDGYNRLCSDEIHTILDIVGKEIATAVEAKLEEVYKEALDDMFLEIAKLAEPDERQPSAGDLHTNMDDIHSIRVKLLTTLQKEEK